MAENTKINKSYDITTVCPGCEQTIDIVLSVNHDTRLGTTHAWIGRPINHICPAEHVVAAQLTKEHFGRVIEMESAGSIHRHKILGLQITLITSDMEGHGYAARSVGILIQDGRSGARWLDVPPEATVSLVRESRG